MNISMNRQGVDDNDITFLYGGQPQIEAHAKASEMLCMSRHRFTRLLTINTQSVSQSVSTCQLCCHKTPILLCVAIMRSSLVTYDRDL